MYNEKSKAEKYEKSHPRKISTPSVQYTNNWKHVCKARLLSYDEIKYVSVDTEEENV